MFDSLFNVDSKEEKFWNWFKKNSNKYFNYERDQDNLFYQLKQKLDEIDLNLVFEFSKVNPDGNRKFIISADGIKQSFSNVFKLVELAPKMRGWEIVALRQPHPEINEIRYGHLFIDFNDIYFSYKKGISSIDLSLHIKEFDNSDEWTPASFIILDNIVGEHLAETYLGKITKELLDKDIVNELKPLSDLLQVLKDFEAELTN
jgi:hypothetical protein